MPVVDLTAQRTGKQGKRIRTWQVPVADLTAETTGKHGTIIQIIFSALGRRVGALQICIVISIWQVPVEDLTAQRTGKQVKREKRRGIREEKR